MVLHKITVIVNVTVVKLIVNAFVILADKRCFNEVSCSILFMLVYFLFAFGYSKQRLNSFNTIQWNCFFSLLHWIQKYHRELSVLSIFTTLLVQFLGMCKSLLKQHRILRHIDLNLLIQSSRCVSLCLLLSSYLLRSFFNRVSVIHLGLFLSMHMFMLVYTYVCLSAWRISVWQWTHLSMCTTFIQLLSSFIWNTTVCFRFWTKHERQHKSFIISFSRICKQQP